MGRHAQDLADQVIVSARATVVAVATGCVALTLAGPASAKPFEQDDYIEVPQCQPATTQLCPQIPTASVGSVLAPSVSFTANNNHCADMIAHIIADGVEVGSDVVGPGQTTRTFDLASYRPQTVGVQAEGIEGGCNTGAVSAWGGTLHYRGIFPLS
jgi:hypothetical protein